MFLLEPQKRVRSSRGKWAISVRAAEVLLYNSYDSNEIDINLIFEDCSRFVYCIYFFFIIFDSSEWAYTNVSDKDENFRTLILLQNQYNLKRKGTFATT